MILMTWLVELGRIGAKMIGRTQVSFLAVLLSFVCANSLQAQSPEKSRTPPVLQPSGTYSTPQGQSQNTSKKESSEVDKSGSGRASASLVSVPAVVMDRNGRYIANLRKEDFRIYEDGVEQSLAYFASVEKPFTVALMLDVSGSTQFQLSQIR